MDAPATPRLRVHSLKQPADFQRTLASASAARTSHFALHHLGGGPLMRQLSTDGARLVEQPVDEVPAQTVWLGLVVPKRHAKRSVTRSLIKRQMRAAFQRCSGLRTGIWVLRLRSGFDRSLFPSAASLPLARAVRSELNLLLNQAANRLAAVRTGV